MPKHYRPSPFEEQFLLLSPEEKAALVEDFKKLGGEIRMMSQEVRQCDKCGKHLVFLEERAILNGREVCIDCYDLANKIAEEIKSKGVSHIEEVKGVHEAFLGYKSMEYNEPQHYHKHKMDTIEFLKQGFPPEVFLHFALANVVKYAQRAEYKNGLEDLDKMVDYAIRARDWYKETHS